MDKLYIVMPAYNEETNIEAAVRSWYKILEKTSNDSKLVVADNGSKDKTHLILENLKKELPKLEILSNTRKEHGPKLISLYKYAINNNADFVFQTDSDGQTNPNEFLDFWNLRNKYDAIIGNRVIRGDGISRKIVENVVCILLKIIFNVDVPDANAPFRLIKCSLLKKYINRFKEDYNIPNIMLTTFFKYYNENIIFKEISFKQRCAGKNSINLIKIIKIGFKAIKDLYSFKIDM